MGDDCLPPKSYWIGKDIELYIEYPERKAYCRCCFNTIKTRTAYLLDTLWGDKTGDKNIKEEDSWYCHKCFKALKNVHNGGKWNDKAN